jgi:hypothetical protein
MNVIRRFLVAALVLTQLIAAAPRVARADGQDFASVRTQEALLSQCVVHIKVKTPDGDYLGTGVYVVCNNGSLCLYTADHVVACDEVNRCQNVYFCPMNADQNDPQNWRRLADYFSFAHVNFGRDIAVFLLARPIEGMWPTRPFVQVIQRGAPVVAFGFAVPNGHVLHGTVRGASDDRNYIAFSLGSDHGDSGGPIFDARTGNLIGLVSAGADRSMSADFIAHKLDSEKFQMRWSGAFPAMGADSIGSNLMKPEANGPAGR